VLLYNLAFLVFALSFLFLPLSFSSTTRKYLLSWFLPVAESARDTGRSVRALTGPGSGDEERQAERDRLDEMRSRLLEARLEIMELRNLLEMRNELRRLRMRRTPYIYLTRILSLGESNPWRKSVTIDRGHSSSSGKPDLVPGLAVTTGRKMIGRVTEVGASSSRVQLITDPDFRLNVITLPPGGKIPEERRQFENPSVYLRQRTGILEGTGRGTLEMTEVLASVFVKSGWEVITAGEPDDPIPRGLLIGTVRDVSSSQGLFKKILVRPAIEIRDIRNAMVLRPRGSVDRDR